ncbi:GNAT family N-acetyltransferase [Streptomyces sp. NPDC058583]|uniref:GNAT family N-acetyltransferase n=1 Tax=unclassified Streptomyces TaxID=2593676 RepID=UPI003667F5B3
MTTHVIRPARTGDGDSIRRLMPLAYDDDAIANGIADGVERNNGEIRHAFGPIDVLICESGDQHVGMLLAQPPLDLLERFAFSPIQLVTVSQQLVSVEIVAVDPAHRRQGIGRALMEEFETIALARGAAKISLSFPEKDPALASWYTKQGYQVVDARAEFELEVGGMILPVSDGDSGYTLAFKGLG